jgi:hypothetical protein
LNFGAKAAEAAFAPFFICAFALRSAVAAVHTLPHFYISLRFFDTFARRSGFAIFG